jgi:hypothetical protein
MPTDPFVTPGADVAVRNEPTLAPGVVLPPARGWRADRPGDLATGVQPRGPLLGSPGPNIGYALRLVHQLALVLELAPGEHRQDADAVIAGVAMKRAASFGRAPVARDVERAAALLGYSNGAAPDVVAWRVAAARGAHHDYGARQRVVDAIALDELRAS